MLVLLTLMACLIRFIGKVVRQAAKSKSEQRFTTFNVTTFNVTTRMASPCRS